MVDGLLWHISAAVSFIWNRETGWEGSGAKQVTLRAFPVWPKDTRGIM